MRILKNVIEVLFNNTPCFIHRENIAGIKCYKNDNIYKLGEYRVAIYLIHPIDQIDDFEFGCNDVEKYIAWFDDDERVEIQKFFETTLEKHKHTAHKLESIPPKPVKIWDTCKCCNEQMLSVRERPEFNNELLCTLCTIAKSSLSQLDYKKTKEEKLLKGYVELNEDLTIKFELEDN